MMNVLMLFTLTSLVLSFVFSVVAIGISCYTLKITNSVMASRDIQLQKELKEEITQVRADMVEGLNSYSTETILAAERQAKDICMEYVGQPSAGDTGGFGTF